MSDEKTLDQKRREWLDDQLDPKLAGQETPRDWLREALKNSLRECKRPMGDSQWAYSLAITMVPAFPEIVKDVKEYAEDDIEFTFDWKKFEEILNSTIDALINEEMDTEES
jgi:hypothetical protein